MRWTLSTRRIGRSFRSRWSWDELRDAEQLRNHGPVGRLLVAETGVRRPPTSYARGTVRNENDVGARPR
jgi:hypothetical protein